MGEELGYAEDTTPEGIRVIADKYRNAYGAMNQPPAPEGNVGPYASGYRTGQPPAPFAVEGGPPADALAYLRAQGQAGGSPPAAPPVGTLPATTAPATPARRDTTVTISSNAEKVIQQLMTEKGMDRDSAIKYLMAQGVDLRL